MKWYLLAYSLLLVLPALSQESDTYTDNKVLGIPKEKTYHADSIATYIRNNFPTDTEKIRAVYTWVTNNISYSKDSMYYFRRWGTDPSEKLNNILRRRKGVCENYAELVVALLQKTGITAIVVSGYTKTGSTVNWSGHAWIAVKTGKEWTLSDPTWDAGRNGDYRYYVAAPSVFIETHMPFDPMWQLLEHPWSHRDFRNGYTKNKKEETAFNFSDSITTYLQSDTLQQMITVSRRMNTAGLENEDLKTWYAYNQMKVNIVLQEENMQLFNDAVGSLNEAKRLFNNFINFRNNHFKPAQTDAAIKTMFVQIENLIAASYNKMQLVGLKAENYQYDTDGLKENLDKLSTRINEQKNFLIRYFETPVAEREKLLYH